MAEPPKRRYSSASRSTAPDKKPRLTAKKRSNTSKSRCGFPPPETASERKEMRFDSERSTFLLARDGRIHLRQEPHLCSPLKSQQEMVTKNIAGAASETAAWVTNVGVLAFQDGGRNHDAVSWRWTPGGACRLIEA